MNNSKEKDYYVPVLAVQIFVCFILILFINFFGRNDIGIKDEFKRIIESNIVSLEVDNFVENIRKELYTGEIFTFLNIKDKLQYEDVTVPSDGSGGKDIDFYEAAENASFSPVLSTVEIYNPVENGRYTSYFGYRTNPITGDYGFHTGLDIGASEGTQIRAAFSGIVTKSGFDSQAGNYIYLAHDEGFETFYCHCSELLVSEGACVRQGEAIALVGSTGWATGPHLHFEIRKDNIRYNPLWLLEK